MRLHESNGVTPTIWPHVCLAGCTFGDGVTTARLVCTPPSDPDMDLVYACTTQRSLSVAQAPVSVPDVHLLVISHLVVSIVQPGEKHRVFFPQKRPSIPSSPSQEHRHFSFN